MKKTRLDTLASLDEGVNDSELRSVASRLAILYREGHGNTPPSPTSNIVTDTAPGAEQSARGLCAGDEAVAGSARDGAQRREVGAGFGLGEALDPELPVEDRR